MAEVDASYDEQMSKLLDDNSTDLYYIEYGGFKTNHLSQLLVALGQLKAPIPQVKKAVNWIKHAKLEDTEMHKEKEMSLGSEPEDPFNVLGTEKHYYYLKKYYSNLLEKKYDGSFQHLVACEFPKISCGMLGAATHGLIHTGYGCFSGKNWFVVEGLAYLHDQYAAPKLDMDFDVELLGNGQKDILEVMDLLRNDNELIQFVTEDAKSDKYDKYDIVFEKQMHSIYQKRGNDLLKYVQMIKFPNGLNGKEFTKEKVINLANWIVNTAIIVYAIAERKNDFFLLHAITSGWALKNILLLLSSKEDILKSVRDFLMALMTVYVLQGYPALRANLLSDNNGMSFSWDDLVERAITHDSVDREHMYKLVQVCTMMREEKGNSDMESMYRLASHVCLDYPFVY